MRIKIIACNCTHSFQDLRYGTQKRVHNRCAGDKKSLAPEWRCTVCATKRGG